MGRWCLLACWAAAACLEPPDDGLDPRLSLGPDIDPETALHVEDDPEIATDAFPDALPYLRGFAEGEPIWFWEIPGPVQNFLAPLYIIERDGEPIGTPVIDVIPGMAGYTPLWRIVRVQVTDTYDGEHIWSRAAVDAGVELGILQTPVTTNQVALCPVVKRSTELEVGGGAEPLLPTLLWFQDRRVSFFDFPGDLEVDAAARRAPDAPLYVLRRFDQPFVLNEYEEGIDLDGDGRKVSSNNVFAAGFGSEGYTPLWLETEVRTSTSYPSFDIGEAPGIVDAGQIVGSDLVDPDPDVVAIEPDPSRLRLCPIQQERGQF